MKIIAIVFLLLSSLVASAALPPTNYSKSYKYSNILESLKLPRKNRLQNLKSKIGALDKLHFIANDNKQPLRVRWRAITTMGEMAPIKAQKHLEKLLVRKEWFLRNAAMIGISHSARPVVMEWAERLLNDRSLMVRTSAVQAIKKVKGVELQDVLWEKINSKENFHRGKSLWIRKHMADTLASFAYKGDETKFLRLLLDRDKRLHPFALRGLRKSTGLKIQSNRNLEQRRLAWIKYYKNKPK